jgi:hypothetical protein
MASNLYLLKTWIRRALVDIEALKNYLRLAWFYLEIKALFQTKLLQQGIHELHYIEPTLSLKI